jgi:predicted transcriptional regulator
LESKEASNGLLYLLGLIVTGLFTWWGTNKVKNENKSGDRHSRFEQNLQARYDALQERCDELVEQLQQARDGRALLARQLHEQKHRTKNLLEMLAPEARQAVERWVESSFAPFDSISKRRKP